MTKLNYVGCDPEIFVRKEDTKEFVSAHGLIPGTKESPHPVENGAVQVDGMAAEFNINPASSEDDFVKKIKSVMSTLEGMMPNYELVPTPCVTFPQEVWDSCEEEAKILGCEPDFNAYTGEENTPPDPEVDFRTAAGHIHLGWTNDIPIDDIGHFQACQILARELDYHLALTSTFVDRGESTVKRRELYGSPGAFRPKSYGMEYRVLSNFWVQDEEYMRWVYRVCHHVFNRLISGESDHQELTPLVHSALTTDHEFDWDDLISVSQKSVEMPPNWKEVYFEDRRNPFDEAVYMFGQKNSELSSTIYF